MHLVPHPAKHFEELVAKLFLKLEGKQVKTRVQSASLHGQRYEADIMFGDRHNLTVAEVKHYRYLSPPRAELFVRALQQAQTIKLMMGARRGLLVISCPLTPELSDAAHMFEEIEVWDSVRLFREAAPHPDLFSEFEQLFEVSAPTPPRPSTNRDTDNRESHPEEVEGTNLANKLLAIAPGKAQSRDFEDACIAALKYLFESDLHGWHEQDETDDSLHRRDLVCRILPNSEIWRLMLTDLHTRYVVFEFKNYSTPITQSEILTTEKYLYPSALRKVAIIISPLGSAKSAIMVMQGAMREHGKLILSLTVEEITSLLVGKDGGADPNTYLFDQVDKFLMGLGR